MRLNAVKHLMNFFSFVKKDMKATMAAMDGLACYIQSS